MKKIIICVSALFCTALTIIAFAIIIPNSKGCAFENYPKQNSVNKIIDVPKICQYPTLPTGCESVSATMVLQYYGEALTSEEFASSLLKCSEDFYTLDGIKYGPDPHKYFVGNPFSNYSYGCYPEPIVDAVNKKCSYCKAEKITGKALKGLCKEYIDHNEPVLIWATMNMKPPKRGNSWYLASGEYFVWTAGEHCLVLVGYDSDSYIFNDPMTGKRVSYNKQLAEKRYKQLGSQAVLITLKNNRCNPI